MLLFSILPSLLLQQTVNNSLNCGSVVSSTSAPADNFSCTPLFLSPNFVLKIHLCSNMCFYDLGPLLLLTVLCSF